MDVSEAKLETLVADVPEARSLAVSGERVVWIEKRDGWRVRELGRDAPWAKVNDRAWDLRIAGDAPIWGRARSSLFGGNAPYETEIVTVGETGKLQSLGRFVGDENYVYPRFDADARRIACLTGRDVTIVDRQSGAQCPLGLARRIESVALDGDALWVIALGEDRYSGELLRVDLQTGAAESRLSYRRMLFHQERLSLAAAQVAWNVGGEALSVRGHERSVVHALSRANQPPRPPRGDWLRLRRRAAPRATPHRLRSPHQNKPLLAWLAPLCALGDLAVQSPRLGRRLTLPGLVASYLPDEPGVGPVPHLAGPDAAAATAVVTAAETTTRTATANATGLFLSSRAPVHAR